MFSMTWIDIRKNRIRIGKLINQSYNRRCRRRRLPNQYASATRCRRSCIRNPNDCSEAAQSDCRYADWRPNLYHQIKWVSSLVAVPSDLPLPPAVQWLSERERKEERKERSFTSIQMIHTHIRITSACTSHILQTASYTRYTYHWHTTKVTHLYMHIHTYTQTHPPSPSITLILPLPLLLFCAQSKSGEVVNMWGYPVL